LHKTDAEKDLGVEVEGCAQEPNGDHGPDEGEDLGKPEGEKEGREVLASPDPGGELGTPERNDSGLQDTEDLGKPAEENEGRAGPASPGSGSGSGTTERNEGRAGPASPDFEEEEELEQLPHAVKERDPLRYAKIKWESDGKVCFGHVEDIEVGKISGERLYFIRFVDGDVLHMSEQQVRS
jgi:hypothetical protein